MITLDNYKEKTATFDFDLLPAKFKEGHKYVTEFGDLYNDDTEIKEVIDLYLSEINKVYENFAKKGVKSVGVNQWVESFNKNGFADVPMDLDKSSEEKFLKAIGYDRYNQPPHEMRDWENIVRYRNPKEKNQKELAFGSMGSGTTVWWKGTNETIAHISDYGDINYYGKTLPEYAVKQIEAMAKMEKARIQKTDKSATPTNLSELKKFLTVGKKIWLVKRDGKYINAMREVAKVQTNSIAFKIPGKDELTWLPFEKASEYTFTKEGFKVQNLEYEYSPAFDHLEEPTNCQILDAEGKPDISPAAIKKLEDCTETLTQTKTLVQVNGKYPADRLKIHDKIISEFKQNKPCIVQRQPVAVLTGGPPGSGKSTWLKKYAKWISSDNVYHIDADEVRAKLPEYKGWNATQTHLETKDIVNRLIDDIGNPCEFDLVYDGTMNKAESYQPIIDKLKKLGYKVFIIYISVPKEVSQKRVLERYRKRGRYVPKVVIEEVYERGLAAFEKLIKEADGFIRVDGETGKLLEKGGMEIPKKERYSTKAEKPHDCGCQHKKEEEKCEDCKDHEKPHRETKEEVATRHKNAEQFIKDLEAQPDKLKNMSENQIIQIGLDFHRTYRASSAQKRDGSHDSVKRLSPKPENLIRWMKNPGKFDLIGVDTFERIDPTADYKLEISKQKFWNNIFGIKKEVKTSDKPSDYSDYLHHISGYDQVSPKPTYELSR
jgi:predicted ABC-type ATPase